jgi:hypothetical protein
MDESSSQNAHLSGRQFDTLLLENGLNLSTLAVMEIPLQANPHLNIIAIDSTRTDSLEQFRGAYRYETARGRILAPARTDKNGLLGGERSVLHG